MNAHAAKSEVHHRAAVMRIAPLLSRLASIGVAAAFATSALAADPVGSERTTPGTVAPSTGVTVPTPAPAVPTAPARTAAKKAGSLSGATGIDCTALRREYARSQACFAPYRLANGGLRPEASKRCREVPNPAPKCGSEVVDPN